MKRSEMLHKLRDHMWSQTDFITGEQYIDADDLLVFIEKSGMLPPSVESVVTPDEIITASEICYWEKENE